MGRKIRRVPVGFDHPVGKIWPGFVNPYHPRKCPQCGGSGLALAVRGESQYCPACEGNGTDPADEAVRLSEAWEPTYPPEGEAYQLWETVSEGSPITPVFADPMELARWCEAHQFDGEKRPGGHRWNHLAGGDETLTADQWLQFITGPGWAFSMVVSREHGIESGVAAAVRESADTNKGRPAEPNPTTPPPQPDGGIE